MPGVAVRLIFLVLCLGVSHASADEAPADFVFTGGGVYTVNPEQPWAEAVAVRNGRIVYVGDEAGVASFAGDGTRVIDLDGRMLLPGFHDSHSHPMAAGTRFLRCRLHGLEWPEEAKAALAECASKLGPDEWLRGVGLPEQALEGDGPGLDVLDAISEGRPAYVTDFSGFVAWANSRALERAGLDARRIGAGGIVRGAANDALYRVLPRYEQDELRLALRKASAIANAFGITSVNEAKVTPGHWEAYVAADRANELTLRVQGSLLWQSTGGMEQLDDLERRRREARGSRFRADAVKLFLDGSADRRDAALLEPYVGREGYRGELYYPQAQLEAIVTALDAAGFQFHAHAYGDRAVRSALDAIESAIRANGPRDRRHQLAHVALVHPADLPRFAGLGVTADYHGLWAWLSPARVREVNELGAERAKRFMAMRDLFDSGARVVGGSDWISESMNPLYSIQVAITRRPPDGSGPAWIAEQRATLEEMIRAYTINGAWLARQEDETGTIEVGKAADLAVLERNLFEADPMALKDVPVLLTLLEGVEVYRAEGGKD